MKNIQMMADETMAYNARTEIKYRLQSLQQQLLFQRGLNCQHYEGD